MANTYLALTVGFIGGSLVAQVVKKNSCNAGDWGPSLGLEDPLEKGMATHSDILAWRIPWTGSLMRYNLWIHRGGTHLGD